MIYSKLHTPHDYRLYDPETARFLNTSLAPPDELNVSGFIGAELKVQGLQKSGTSASAGVKFSKHGVTSHAKIPKIITYDNHVYSDNILSTQSYHFGPFVLESTYEWK